MPQFKSTYNILIKPDEDEVFESSWVENSELILPPSPSWDYGRELTIDDVDIWEVLFQGSHGLGVYAAWCPHADFYMITTGFDTSVVTYDGPTPYCRRHVETYYGANSQSQVYQRAKELGIHLQTHTVWAEDNQIWLHQKPEKKIIIS